MLEYFLGLITSPVVLLVLVIGYFVVIRTIRAMQRAPKYIPEDQQVTLDITSKSDEIVGSFLGNPIYKQITISNGNTYVFESIAVEQEPNVFIAEYPKASYVLYEGLLYRKVS